MHDANIKIRVQELRQRGYYYAAILREVGVSLPKSTVSSWCSKVQLSAEVRQKFRERASEDLVKAREASVQALRRKRSQYLHTLTEQNKHLRSVLTDHNVAKIALAMLYLGEGAKTRRRGSVVFGNSDSQVIVLFLTLLRLCYDIDEKKFRCTLQCRADQDISRLERFWSSVTKIPPSQFYPAQIDPRTVGRPSRLPDYKGVCRIDYFSANILNDLLTAAEVVQCGPVA